MRKREKVEPFTPAEAEEFLAFADAVLAQPPKRPHTERYPGKGRLLLRFALPLGMAQPLNRSRKAPTWKAHDERERLLNEMERQLARQARILVWPAPLPGRPMLRAIRFSAGESDVTACWFKVATDVLLVPRMRKGKRVPALNVLRDDRPSMLELRHWTEPAPPNRGGAMVEIWTGKEE
jgi:hypothetical protein